MAQYDGSIRINTNISTKDAKAQLSVLMHTVVKTANEIKLLRSKMDALKDVRIPTNEFTTLEAEIKKATSEYEKLQEKIKNSEKPTKEYTDAQKEVNKYSNSLQRAKEKIDKLLSLGFDQKGSAFISAQYDVAKFENKLLDAEKAVKKLEQEGKAFAPTVDAKELEEAKKKVDELKQKMKELKVSGKDTVLGKDTDEYKNLARQLKNEQKALTKYTLKFMSTGVSDILSGAKSGYKKLAEVVKGVFSKINRSTKKSSSLIGTLGNRFKSLALSLLIFNQISKAFNAMISGIKEGFGNLYKDVSGFRDSVNELKASMLTLKNSFAAAFRPLVEITIPYIQKAVDALINFMNIIGQFTAAITGQETYTRAIRQTTEAIEDESKAQNKQLSGLDKLNNLTTDKSGKSGGSENGKMFEENVPISNSFLDIYKSLKEMIENQDWESIGNYISESLNRGLQKIYKVLDWNNVEGKVRNFVNSFTGAFNGLLNSFDWELLGRTIGSGINTAINSMNLLIRGIDWEKIGSSLSKSFNGIAGEINFTELGKLIGNKFMILPTILLGFVSNLDWGKIGDSIGQTLNGVISSIDLSVIGETLGKGITGIFQSAINFSATFDWEALGTNIYNGINSFFENTDWEIIGKGTSDIILGIFHSFLTAINGIDWKLIGESIATALNNIDWVGIVSKLTKSVSSLLVAAADLVIGFVETVDWEKLGSDIWDSLIAVITNIDWGTLISQAFELLGAALAAAVSLITGFAKSVWETLKSAFEETVNYFDKYIDEAGGNVILGLLNGILNAVKNIGSWIKEHIFQPFIDGFKKVFGIHSPSTVMEEQGKFLMEGLFNGISGLVEKVISVFSDIKKKIIEKWREIKEKTSEIWNGIKAKISGIWSDIKRKVSESVQHVKTTISNVMNAVKEAWNGVWDKIFGKVSDILGNIKDAIGKAFDWISEKVSGILEKLGLVSTKTETVKKSTGGAFAKITESAIPCTSSFIPEMDIPGYATGQVIPRTMRQHLAILGDNSKETEVVSPLSTMKQALKEAISEMGGGLGNGKIELHVVANVDGKTLFEITQDYAMDYFNRTKRSPYPI